MTHEQQTGFGTTWVEHRESPGLVEMRVVFATKWRVKERTNCFCCSCDDDMDPNCRNHGFDGRKLGMMGKT